MNLLVDLGNSRIKWTQSSVNRSDWRMHSSDLSTEEMSTLLGQLWSGLPKPEQVFMVSVATTARQQQCQQWVQKHWAVPLHQIRSQREQLGVRNTYYDPATLGGDRWVALIAARHTCQAPVCVIDCGTAVTLDVLDATGSFLGGVIFPGLNLLRQSLTQGTAAITQTTGDSTACPGLDTADGVAAGTLMGLCGALERITTEYRQQLGPAMQCIITGGDAAQLLPLLKFEVEAIPDLVLQGLALIAEREA